jgi:hypothetical protein
MRPSHSIWSQWWRVGGLLGVAFIILFIVAGIALQGETPFFDDPINEVRTYFDEDGTRYLVGDYLNGIAFVFLFLPFLIILRGVLSWVEGPPNILSWLAFAGGIATVILGGAAGISWGALAMGAATDPEVDDTSIRTLMYVDAFAFSALSLTLALFVLAASAVIFRTGVLWRGLAALGLLAGVAGIIGGAWPIEGESEGVLEVIGFIGFLGFALWMLLASINMLVMRGLPPRAVPAVAAHEVRIDRPEVP